MLRPAFYLIRASDPFEDAAETLYPVDVQWWRTRREDRRPDGTASTARHNATIASPINSIANASMTNLPQGFLDLSGSR